ncbi:hypothetical protein B0H13DRAFT_1880839 [Mycena leptocephala]|nr:hypothetical protein B0H13DRAFT_1880839 [Mycena leptocephala]
MERATRSGSGNGNGNMISNVNRESVHSFRFRLRSCIRLQSGLMHITSPSMEWDFFFLKVTLEFWLQLSCASESAERVTVTHCSRDHHVCAPTFLHQPSRSRVRAGVAGTECLQNRDTRASDHGGLFTVVPSKRRMLDDAMEMISDIISEGRRRMGDVIDPLRDEGMNNGEVGVERNVVARYERMKDLVAPAENDGRGWVQG